MIKAYKYNRDDQTEEIFIPDYKIAFGISNNLYVISKKLFEIPNKRISIEVSEKDAYLFQELEHTQRVLEQLKEEGVIEINKYLSNYK